MRRTFLVAVAAMALPLPCRAADANDAAVAEALFRAGRDAADRGDPATACTRFQESYRLDAAIGTLLNLADCEEQLGRLARAWEHYRRVSDALALSDERLPVVRERLSRLEPRVPKLTLLLREGAPLDIRVTRDGVLMTHASFGVALPVDPGSHDIVVMSSGRTPRHYTVVLAEGQRSALTIEPGPGSSPPSVGKPSARKDGHAVDPLRTVAFISLGAGAASLVVGAFLGLSYADERSKVSDHCPTEASCDDEGLRAVGAADVLQSAALATAALAGISIGGGMVLLLTRPSDPGTHPNRPSNAWLGWRTMF
jgi:hypothetical protein